MEHEVLMCVGLGKSIKERQVTSLIDFTLKCGEVTWIVWPSGCAEGFQFSRAPLDPLAYGS